MIRDFKPSDCSELWWIHHDLAQGYTFPQLMDSPFVVKKVCVEDGKVVAAVLARKTAELYFLPDMKWQTPKWRFEVLRELHESVRQDLAAQGFEDAVIWIPPTVKQGFIRRLKRCLGLIDVPWHCLTRSTKNAGT